MKQITNDVYDDLDPTFVSFPNRTGVIFASLTAWSGLQVLTHSGSRQLPFQYFLVDLLNNSDFKQITQLTNVKYGNARYPMQYNQNHFTYVSDENGVGNRWAGFSQHKEMDSIPCTTLVRRYSEIPEIKNWIPH